MGFLRKFFGGESMKNTPSSFEKLSKEEIDVHLRITRYNDFVLTDAIRPSYNLNIVPRNGFRFSLYNKPDGSEIPFFMISVSQEIIFSLFMDLIDLVGEKVAVVLETSHEYTKTGKKVDREHKDMLSEDIDLVVLKSILYEFEDLLLDDGCTGIAVFNAEFPIEVQLEEHSWR